MDYIAVTVGRTGKLGFVGYVSDTKTGKPVHLCGTSVSKVTLHNQDYINDMSIGVGGTYLIKKSGDIIPKLCGVVKKPDTTFVAPSLCPMCGEPVYRENDSADIRCFNPTCPAQLSRSLSYFTSVDCMNIIGLGETLIDTLIENGYLKSFVDIYRLKDYRDELIEKKIIGKEKNTDKILKAIENSKANDPSRLLISLGIRNAGKHISRELMRRYKSIEKVMSLTREELLSIPDVGETIADGICAYFANPVNVLHIRELKFLGVNMMAESDDEDGEKKLSGKTIVVTGTLPTLGRKEIEELIIKNGGKCSGSVSKKTDYLVAGDAAGSKLTKAQELGIKIVTEEEFLKMI